MFKCYKRVNINPISFPLQIPSDKLVKVLGILEKNIQDGSKLSTLMNHVSVVFTLPLVTLHTLQLCSGWLITESLNYFYLRTMRQRMKNGYGVTSSWSG